MELDAIQLKNVSKRFKGFEINNLNLRVPQGFITGFIGPNGAGKSTVIKMILDVLRADEGEISILNRPNTDIEVKKEVGFVYDTLYMYEDFNLRHMKMLVAPLYPNWDEELYRKYLERFELPERKKIKKFSQGMKMKTSLLFALAHRPSVIIMDEPTSGLDPIFRRELLEDLQELMVNERQTIFFSTHITQDLDQIADHIIFIHQGQLQFHKSMEEIRNDFYLVKAARSQMDEDVKQMLLGFKETATGFSGLINGAHRSLFQELESDFVLEPATLEDIMYFMTRKGNS